MTVPEDNAAKNNKSRLLGVALLLLAGIACYLSIIMPLQEAHAGADKISWGAEWAFLAPPLVVMGLLVIIFPNLNSENNFLMKSKDKLSLAGWILVAVLLGFGGGCYYWVNHQLETLGYVDGLQTPGSK